MSLFNSFSLDRRTLMTVSLGLVSTFWFFYSWRWIAALGLAFMLMLFISRLARNQKAVRWMMVALVAINSLPIDTTFENREGPPQIVPVVYGLPNERGYAEQMTGEIYIGSDVELGYQPRWVVIW